MVVLGHTWGNHNIFLRRCFRGSRGRRGCIETRLTAWSPWYSMVCGVIRGCVGRDVLLVEELLMVWIGQYSLGVLMVVGVWVGVRRPVAGDMLRESLAYVTHLGNATAKSKDQSQFQETVHKFTVLVDWLLTCPFVCASSSLWLGSASLREFRQYFFFAWYVAFVPPTTITRRASFSPQTKQKANAKTTSPPPPGLLSGSQNGRTLPTGACAVNNILCKNSEGGFRKIVHNNYQKALFGVQDDS